MNIYPAILSDSIKTVQKQLDLCKQLEDCRVVQLDVIDGYFVDNITIAPDDLVDLDLGELQVDVHLMTQEPLEFVHMAEDAGIQKEIRSCIGQVERVSSQESFISDLHRIDWRAGLSIDVYTPLDTIDEKSWHMVDVIQIMAIEAGYQGQEFRESAYAKIKEVADKKRAQSLPFELIVDGGVKLENIERIYKQGADGVAVGSQLWEAVNLSDVYTQIKKVGS